MINENKLTKDIMSRIRTIYYGRLLARPVLELAVLLGLVYAAKMLIFWQAAIFNMAQLSVNQWFSYIAQAFLHTEFMVQLVLAAILAAVTLFLWQIKDILVAVIKPDSAFL